MEAEYWLLFFHLFGFSWLLHGDTGTIIELQTKYGRLQGKRFGRLTDAGGQADYVDRYMGIPYASPPTGAKRFTAPVPPPAWEGTRPALEPGHGCQQNRNLKAGQMSENCLFLDIYSPLQMAAPNKTYAVLVYIHGGSYLHGSSRFLNGRALAQNGAVVVVINYRVSFLGFFSTGDDTAPGNYGILDQIQTLKWIKENIVSFRGDPNLVTIWGQSAGATAVGILLTSPVVKGLFHRAILQSGSPVATWAIYNKTESTSGLKEYAQQYIYPYYGCSNDESDVLSCLRSQNATKLIHFPKSKYPWFGVFNLIFMPRIDGTVFLEWPEKLFKANKFHKVPVMIGVTSEEWALNVGWLAATSAKFEERRLTETQLLGSIRNVVKRFGMSDAVAKAAFDEYTVGVNFNDHRELFNRYIQLTTDLIFVAPAVRLAQMLVDKGVPVYEYIFDQRPQGKRPDKDFAWAAFHKIDLNYVFGAPFTGSDATDYGLPGFGDLDKKLSRTMMAAFVDFATYGKPCNVTTCHLNSTWGAFHSGRGEYMYFSGSKSEMRNHLRRNQTNFWNTVAPIMLKYSKYIDGGGYILPVSYWLLGAGILALICAVTLAILCLVRRKSDRGL